MSDADFLCEGAAQPELSTARLRLRLFGPDDAGRVQQLAGDTRLSDNVPSIPHPYSDGVAEKWIATHLIDWDKHRFPTWAICLRDDTLVGSISLITHRQQNRAELGYWIGCDYWGQGICTEAAQAVVRFAFDRLKLARIGAYHLAGNLASGRVMQKLGMQYEGTRRQYLLLNGRRHDDVCYGLLPTDVETS